MKKRDREAPRTRAPYSKDTKLVDPHGVTWVVAEVYERHITLVAGGLRRTVAPERIADWARA